MADQHRYSEDLQRGGRRDWNERYDSRGWGDDHGRRRDSGDDQGRYDEGSGREWSHARGGRGGSPAYDGPGRQFGARDDRDVAPYSGGWSDGGRSGQGDWQSSSFGQRGGSGWSGGYGQPLSQGDGYGQRAGQPAERGRGYAGSGYAGRGPKDYQRSDDRIREEISDRLTDDDRVDASDVTVQVQKGEVTLSGTVNSRDQKRCAEDCAEGISGVREVINNLRVARDDGAGHSGQRASQGGSQSGPATGSPAGRSGSKTAGQSGGVS